MKTYETAIDKHIDGIAQAKGYDSRITASLRASSTGIWKDEGVAFLNWMDSCYDYVYTEFTEIKAGNRTQPSIEELIAELPVIVWPSE